MKTPLDPLNGGLADARGTKPREERDVSLRSADAKAHESGHTITGCNGTETLASIERALLRLSSGTYGICISCGADISLRRLEQNPAVETCDRCSDKVSFKAH
ncbi:MAG: TraR/DksA C4-type zinc finger protein [Pseudomonadota bacterium]